MRLVFLLSLLMVGCATTNSSDFQRVHARAKTDGEACYGVAEAIEINGVYCLKYMGELEIDPTDEVK